MRSFLAKNLLAVLILIACTAGLFQNLRIMSVQRLDNADNFCQYMFNCRLPGSVNQSEWPVNWRSRLVACQTTAWWLELWGSPDPPEYNISGEHAPDGKFKVIHVTIINGPYQNAFASYYCLWFLATGFLVIFFNSALGTSQSAIVIPLMLAGILSDSPGRLSPYFFSWDFAAMFWFAGAFILWASRYYAPVCGEVPGGTKPGLPYYRLPLFIGVLILGGLFKETVLVAALFYSLNHGPSGTGLLPSPLSYLAPSA